jgi:hypothetical protein
VRSPCLRDEASSPTDSEEKSGKHLAGGTELTDAYRVEEYVDAEMYSEGTISWRLEITVSQNGYSVEADVRRNHSDRQDLVAEVGGFSYLTPATCSGELSTVVDKLCEAFPL